MGSAKGQKAGGTGLILREDQQEFMRGMRSEDIRRQKEERQLERAAKAQAEGKGKGLGSWNDPDVGLKALPLSVFRADWLCFDSGYQRFSPLACRAREGTRRAITCRKSVTGGGIRTKCARRESRLLSRCGWKPHE